ncbi:ubiquinone biosynthesis protein COQ9 [Niveomyces insectorum RCEF 264]|uniref:Ubiquinone biosynthesis protein n=1 Tax=Niveomyces insectorum RCEF 264 TaxID=1081102 RepID=A0A167MLA1_9HYPO|nr:ubiquinone biosynthesis protein COQ9 [Niveomyces insectorum RCEF 264]
MRPSPASTAAAVVVVAGRLATPARPAAFRRLAASPARRLPAAVSPFSRASGMHPALLQKPRSRALHITTHPLVAPRAALAAHSRALFGDDAAVDAVDAAEPAPPLSPAAVADRAERLTWARLLGNTAVIGRWQELARLADEIWAQAGDTAVDPTWYTKRAALGSIYAASELFMTTDRSPGFADTRAFLHRRCGEAQALGGRVRAVGEWVGFTASAGLNVLRSKGVGI